ncbi:DUF86 domain-containing protein [Paenibacillus antibioticophila]|uniref:DUF86 domain-containing protein n=1 Tax=Paenibacillus antibioticophila TaxID=1274374 RepID=A0A919XUC5_9BACL|nr:DUF86 domain-containing protein [Paenibacillus antibioticophila]GIO36817.1 DUF86 domain-containing protein [Paenibacillus antibioticophila]
MKDEKVYLTHILECIENIFEFTQTGKEEFFRQRIIQDAVIRNLEIMGEATKKISKEYRNQYLNIPWREMAGLRDVLIHDYFGVDIQAVWSVVKNELPGLHKQIKVLLNE